MEKIFTVSADNQSVRVISNPSRNQLINFALSSRNNIYNDLNAEEFGFKTKIKTDNIVVRELRGFISDNEIFVWNGYYAIHDDMRAPLGIDITAVSVYFYYVVRSTALKMLEGKILVHLVVGCPAVRPYNEAAIQKLQAVNLCDKMTPFYRG